MNILGALALLCFALAASVVLLMLVVLGVFEEITERIDERRERNKTR